MRLSFVPLVVAAFAAPALYTSEVHAFSLADCGNIDVSANANCKVLAMGECTAQCTPINVSAACDAKLQASCSGQCNASADVMCTSSCNTTCMGDCNGNPGSFDCEGACKAQCNGDCTSRCSASADRAQCTASCQANCSATCSGQCKGTPPSATCMAKCQACCSGSCTAKVNAQCQIDCSAMGHAQCVVDVEGGCKAQCSKPEGAIFCDGKYIDAGGNLQKCMEALNAVLNVKVDASGSCSSGSCMGKAGISCGSIAPGEPAVGGTGILVGIGAALVAFARRHKRR